MSIRNCLFVTGLALIGLNTGVHIREVALKSSGMDLMPARQAEAKKALERQEEARAARNSLLTPAERAEVEAMERYYGVIHGYPIVAGN